MREDDLAKDLRDSYAGAQRGDKVVSIYLFGIRNAEHLRSHNPYALAERAGLKRSYGTEIAKAIRLAEHVTLR